MCSVSPHMCTANVQCPYVMTMRMMRKPLTQHQLGAAKHPLGERARLHRISGSARTSNRNRLLAEPEPNTRTHTRSWWSIIKHNINIITIVFHPFSNAPVHQMCALCVCVWVLSGPQDKCMRLECAYVCVCVWSACV